MQTKKESKAQKQAFKLNERQKKLLKLHAKAKQKPTIPTQPKPNLVKEPVDDPSQSPNSEQSEQEVFDFAHAKEYPEAPQQIQFTFIEPAETMYHSLKTLLANYSTMTGNKVYDLADRIAKRKEYGVAIIEDQQDDDGLDTVFSILTILPIDDTELMKTVKQHFVAKCKAHCKDHKKLMKQIEGKSIGVLVNERFVNLPPKLVPIQHTTFANDHEELKKKNPKLLKELSCDYLFVMGQASRDPESHNKQNQPIQPCDLLLKKFEDSVFLQSALGFWTFPMEGQLIGKEQGLCLEYIIETKSYFKDLKTLEALVE